ncbi:MAG: putative 2-oxoglutarate oxidoreductase, delta subunit [Ignavibacteriae bacterium]|nr:MAG: putative 2-oxoglutarate oxidoreductase, delta subunit [Ignavibacteriota bacterium]
MAVKGTVKIDIETCKGCELCVEACPQESLAMSKEINAKGYHYAVLIKDNCTGCINCALVCPDAVITVYRTTKKKEKVPIATIKDVKENIRISIDNPEVPNGEGRIDL